MKYKEGYKYILAEQTKFNTGIHPNIDVVIPNFVSLLRDGTLILGKGYAWNGVNWWPDTKKNMKAGLVHDALYQLMQEGLLEMFWKDDADRTFRDMLKAEGDLSANLCFFAVQKLGNYFIKYPGSALEV